MLGVRPIFYILPSFSARIYILFCHNLSNLLSAILFLLFPLLNHNDESIYSQHLHDE